MDLLMPRLLLSLLFISMLSACGSSSSGSNPDVDGDGVANELDAFPQDARESADTDGDGVGDNSDAFPEDASETLDSDLDGVGDNADVFPNDTSESLDTDGDGVGDNSDEFPQDFDNDGEPDDTDLFPYDPNESTDADGDGIGDNSDPIFDINYENIGLGKGMLSSYQDAVVSTGLSGVGGLLATGSTIMQVNIVDKTNGNSMFFNLVDVYFTSTCAQIGLAEFTPNKSSVSGTATTTYQDKGCGKTQGNTDNILAYIATENDDGTLNIFASATTTIHVFPKEVGAVEFVEATPSTIALAGLSNSEVPSRSQLEFRVLDTHGNPLPEHIVEFELENDLSGAELSVTQAVADQEGKVQVILSAGIVAGPKRVRASVDLRDEYGNPVGTVTTLSSSITMATSLVSQQGFSLTANALNPHAWDQDNNEVIITAYAADSNFNPVIDGTLIYFKESAGLITSSCETLAGECSVSWLSTNPRLVDGSVTILAHARGQGNFQDHNSNGLFDIDEQYQILGEAWLDANGNGSYDDSGDYQSDLDIDNDGNDDFTWNPEGYLVYMSMAGEYSEYGSFLESFVDYNSNDQFDSVSLTKYQGIDCSEGAISEGHCVELLDVSASLRIQMSAGNDIYIQGPYLRNEEGAYDYSNIIDCVDGRANDHQVAWRVADSSQRRNHVPMGTLINITTENVFIKNEIGTGVMPSTQPALALSMWELLPENSALSLDERKNKYLNERGTLIEILIAKPEYDTGESEYGTINLQVETLDGEAHMGDTWLKVDLLGNECPVF